MVNYYELLNVSRNATQEEIELALARYMLTSVENANDAFNILTKEPIRKLYDHSLDAPCYAGEIIQRALGKYVNNDVHMAIEILSEGLHTFPDQREIMLVLSRMYCYTGQAHKSMDILVVLYEKYPDDHDVVFSLGLTYNCLKNYSTSYLYLRCLYKPMIRDVEFLNLYAEACVFLGKYKRAYVISEHNIRCNYGSELLLYSYVYLLISQYFHDKNEVDEYIEQLSGYLDKEVPNLCLIVNCLDKFLYFILDKVMQNEDVALLIKVLVKMYNKVGVGNTRVCACNLALECHKMIENDAHDRILGLCKNHLCLVLSDVFPDLKKETFVAKIAVNMLEMVELYDFTYPEVCRLRDDYPYFSKLIPELIEDFNNLGLEELADKYHDMYDNLINGE